MRLQPADFWLLTPAELAIMVDGELDRREAEYEQIHLAAYMGGRFNRVAFHDPNKYPTAAQEFGGETLSESDVQQEAEEAGFRGPDD